MNHNLRDLVSETYKNLYKEEPRLVVFSPGRINLIGEHTDYNNGFVMPAAIDRGIYIAIGKADNLSEITALDVDDSHEFTLNSIKSSDKSWANYILGIIDEIQKQGINISNFRAVFSGDIPLGAGLSSSAALECGFCFGLNELFNLGLDRESISIIGQQAEHNFVGVKCGIMDQYANVFSKEGHFMHLDCQSLEKQYYPSNLDGYSLVLFDSKISHQLANSAYNQRRAQCESVVATLRKVNPEIHSLRDASIADLKEIRNLVNKDDFIKAKYIIEENLRVLAVCQALKHKDIETLAELVNKTHIGLSKEYEVSCEEVDFLQEYTLKQDGAMGARIMGAGFGGCTINIIKEDHVDEVANIVRKAYKKHFDIELGVYPINISNGTQII